MRLPRPVLVGLFAGLTVVASAGCAGADTSAAAEQTPIVATSEISQDCGVDLASQTIQDAIATLPTEPQTGRGWSTNPAGFQGNFDPCATLSTAIVSIEGATGSSPNHVLLFHQGEYVGTATQKAYGLVSLDASASTDDTVVIAYRAPGTCTACNDGAVTTVGYHWDGTKVETIGTPPN
ncbi:LppP/LprE family lipoprotein [Nocardia callitridis]|uniref:LppP/LprE family lipoprotein n=1 Tax=Nocardia callitridis TaxID=648753 RepID=A0ABP9KPJ0_9NOCA